VSSDLSPHLIVVFIGFFLPGDTLQNCTLELATVGDLKLVERPQPVVLAPHDFCNIKANVKVSSTENGIIFGNIGS
jgi:coatomer subunit beta